MGAAADSSKSLAAVCYCTLAAHLRPAPHHPAPGKTSGYLVAHPRCPFGPSGHFKIDVETHYVCSSVEYDYNQTLICGLPAGCACGDVLCPYGSGCAFGKCIYDENARDGQPIDKDNNISCKLTTIKAPRHDFKCDALGWTCQGTDCPCGDASCNPGDVCIASGTCASVIK